MLTLSANQLAEFCSLCCRVTVRVYDILQLRRDCENDQALGKNYDTVRVQDTG